MIDALDKALGILDPDVDDTTGIASRAKLRRWRLTVGAFIIAASVHILWACGLLPNLSGFAIASDMDKLRNDTAQQIRRLEGNIITVDRKVDAVLQMMIESRIRALVDEVCAADSDRLRTALMAELDGLQAQHKTISGDIYRTSRCPDAPQ